MQLSDRLQAVASMVTENSRLADVGTDHGYIPIYLCEDNTLQLDLLKSMIEKYIFIQAYDMEIRQAVHTPHELLDLLPD